MKIKKQQEKFQKANSMWRSLKFYSSQSSVSQKLGIGPKSISYVSDKGEMHKG